MWLVTTLEQGDPQVLWEMMNRRWDIEENGFHQLKTYYHAKHCYCHAATEVIFDLMLIGFNMRELYLYRRIQGFKESGIGRKSVDRKFCDDLLLEKVKSILYEKGRIVCQWENKNRRFETELSLAKGGLCAHLAIQEAKRENKYRRALFINIQC